MELPVQVTYRNMEPSDAITARIEAEAAKLDTFFNRITSCRVVIEAPHRHHKWGEPFHVRIDLGVPGEELVVSHEPKIRRALREAGAGKVAKRDEPRGDHKDAYVTVRDAFAAMRRQLQDYVKRLRGEVKAHPHGLAAVPPS